MQIGIDVGATKIESVVLEDSGKEHHRSRTDCPKDYNLILSTIKEIPEFNIGHFIIGESIFDGLKQVIKKIRKLSDN